MSLIECGPKRLALLLYLLLAQVCGPTRASILTSRSPITTRTVTHGMKCQGSPDSPSCYWRDVAGNFTTLPQCVASQSTETPLLHMGQRSHNTQVGSLRYFKQHGYDAVSFGKVFDQRTSGGLRCDYPHSWSEYPFACSTGGSTLPNSVWHGASQCVASCCVFSCLRALLNPFMCLSFSIGSQCCVRSCNTVWESHRPDNCKCCNRLVSDRHDGDFIFLFLPWQHGASQRSAPEPYGRIRNRLKNRASKQNFFLAVGFHRPHLPWIVTPEALAANPPDADDDPPANAAAPMGAPPIAWTFSDELERVRTINHSTDAREWEYASVAARVGILSMLVGLGINSNAVCIADRPVVPAVRI
eukprot:COSAG02_NODE_595_length_19813_cov_12.215380_11_plen_357_part_00